MTEADLVQSASAAFNNMTTAFAVLLTLSSGYLVVAYAVGRELLHSQVVIINSIFTLASMFFAGISCGAMSSGVAFGRAAAEVHTAGPTVQAPDFMVFVLLFLCVAIYVGCLKFLWDIRHIKHD